MSSPEFEKFLAALYTDDFLFHTFQVDRNKAILNFQLTEKERHSIESLDMERLIIHRDILKNKNRKKPRKSPWWKRVFGKN